MEAITACLGRKRLCLSAAAALCLMGTGFGKAEPNPWGDSMLKFNIPYAHGESEGLSTLLRSHPIAQIKYQLL